MPFGIDRIPLYLTKYPSLYVLSAVATTIGFAVLQAIIGVMWGKEYIFLLGQKWYFNEYAREEWEEQQKDKHNIEWYIEKLKLACLEAKIWEPVPANRSKTGEAYKRIPEFEHGRVLGPVLAVEVGRMPDGVSEKEFNAELFQEKAIKYLGNRVEYVGNQKIVTYDHRGRERGKRNANYLLLDMSGKYKGMPKPGKVKLKHALDYLNERYPDARLAFPVGVGDKWNEEENGDWKVIKFGNVTTNVIVAGVPGAGKSVFLSTMLSTLMRRNTSKELRIGMIDLKGSELTHMSRAPHLIAPVATNNADALELLREFWEESETRKRVIGKAGNIGEYNRRHPTKKLPYWVLIIDELTGLTVPLDPRDKDAKLNTKEALNTLMLLCQKGRAQGIFTVLCTQRPSSDTLPGSIKGLAMTRVAFAHATNRDSMITIDVGLAASDDVQGNPGRCVLFLGGLAIYQTPLTTDRDIKQTLKIAKENEKSLGLPTRLQRKITAVCETEENLEWIPLEPEEYEKVAVPHYDGEHVLVKCALPRREIAEFFKDEYSTYKIQSAIKDMERFASKGFGVNERNYGFIPAIPPETGKLVTPPFLVRVDYGLRKTQNAPKSRDTDSQASGTTPENHLSNFEDFAINPEEVLKRELGYRGGNGHNGGNGDNGNGHEPETALYPEWWEGDCRHCRQAATCAEAGTAAGWCERWEWDGVYKNETVGAEGA